RDHSKRVLETWFDARVLLEPEATFVDAATRAGSDPAAAGTTRAEASGPSSPDPGSAREGSEGAAVSPAPPTPETPTLRNKLTRRVRIVFESLRGLPSALKEGHYLPIVPVALGMIGLAAGLAGRGRRRAFLLLALMALATLAPLLSHVEGRFLYAPFALGL